MRFPPQKQESAYLSGVKSKFYGDFAGASMLFVEK